MTDEVPPNPLSALVDDVAWGAAYRNSAIVRGLADLLGTQGTVMAAVERRRQIADEGHSLAADAAETQGNLEAAAITYLERPFIAIGKDVVPHTWPWSKDTWKPTVGNRVRELQKAAALAIAALDRELARG